jgi:riboflavin synthase
MFTGLVETMGEVAAFSPEGPGARLTIQSPLIADGLKHGDSVAVNGCCLTVVATDNELFQFEAGSETLKRTNLGKLARGHQVNLERSLKAGDRLGGHFVTGHIDGLGTVRKRIQEGQWWFYHFETPPTLIHHLASKGSIAVDGVSLTVVDVDETSFSVALIPHTLAMTTLGQRQEGDTVNLETDILAKYVERQLAEKQLARPTL